MGKEGQDGDPFKPLRDALEKDAKAYEKNRDKESPTTSYAREHDPVAVEENIRRLELVLASEVNPQDKKEIENEIQNEKEKLRRLQAG